MQHKLFFFLLFLPHCYPVFLAYNLIHIKQDYNSTVQSNPTKVKTGGFFSCVVMHTREKLGKQANKEQVRISSHFIVYSISRELNYKKNPTE